VSVLPETFAVASGRRKASNDPARIEHAPVAQRRRMIMERGRKKADWEVNIFFMRMGIAVERCF
jgi:hypothetical protein